MKYEIFHIESTNMVLIRFEDHVPVEIREALIGAGFDYEWISRAWSGLECPDEKIDRIINSVVVHDRPAMTKDEENALNDEYVRREMAYGWRDVKKWEKFFRERIGAVVKLTDGTIVNIERPSIETRFCYGESGYDMDQAVDAAERARTCESYFRWCNLRGLAEVIRILERRPDESDGFIYRHCIHVTRDSRMRDGIADVSLVGAWDDRHGRPTEEVSEEDRERLLEGYRKVYASFEKRINTYLKRYGLSKVVSWTYWRDA